MINERSGDHKFIIFKVLIKRVFSDIGWICWGDGPQVGMLQPVGVLPKGVEPGGYLSIQSIRGLRGTLPPT